MGLISKIQTYCTQDGPGIRTTVFCIGCNLHCRWCANPETIVQGQKILYHKQKCQGCGCCVAASNGTISLGSDGCIIDRKNCTNLEEMIGICPYDAYEPIGQEISPTQLFERLIRDEVFFQTSGGGVTFSGGEACVQADFVYETARRLKQRGVHVALDTAGCWDLDKITPLLEQVDLILYDIKAMDKDIHKTWTGVDNALILSNATRLASMNKPMHIRLLLIKGINDSPQELEHRFAFVKGLGDAVKRIDVLPYHKLGEGKYAAMQMPYEMDGICVYKDGELEALVKPFQNGKIEIVIGK